MRYEIKQGAMRYELKQGAMWYELNILYCTTLFLATPAIILANVRSESTNDLSIDQAWNEMVMNPFRVSRLAAHLPLLARDSFAVLRQSDCLHRIRQQSGLQSVVDVNHLRHQPTSEHECAHEGVSEHECVHEGVSEHECVHEGV